MKDDIFLPVSSATRKPKIGFTERPSTVPLNLLSLVGQFEYANGSGGRMFFRGGGGAVLVPV